MNFGLLSIPPASCLNCQGARVSSPHRARLAGCSPEPGCAGFQPAFDATGGLLNQEEAMDATPARVMMWFSAFSCAFAPHPPCPLLPQGEKGESGRPEAQNERRNARASKNPTPVRSFLPSSPTSSRADRTFEQRYVFWRCNGQSALTPAPLPQCGRGAGVQKRPCDDHLPFLAPCESGRGGGGGW